MKASNMKIQKRLFKYGASFFATAFCCTVFAQSLEVNRIELAGDNIVLYYELRDSVPQRTYTINVYSSRDNYLNALTSVSGDYGLEIKPGNQKKITWNAKQELGSSFNGKVGVEVRARVYVPFILFDSFDKIKRGKPKDVTWRGGTRQNILNFELYNKDNEKVAVIPNVSNAGHTSLFIPEDVKPGKGYRFKIVDSKNKDQVTYTQPFAVRRKVPLLYYVLGTAVVGGVVSLLIGDDPPIEPTEITDPMGPPGD
jgi:hypothetical protein